MKTNTEVIELIFEFLISVLVIGGGGLLMLFGKGNSEFITSMMALVIYFWFQSRSNSATVKNLLQQIPGLPQQPPTIQTPTVPEAVHSTEPKKE